MKVYILGSQLTPFQNYLQAKKSLSNVVDFQYFFPSETAISRQIFPAKIPSHVTQPSLLPSDDAASFSRHVRRLGGDGPAADSAAAPLPAAGISGSRRSGGNYAARRRCRRRGGQRLPLPALHPRRRRRHRARQG
jgi:hypothetical protein